MTPETRAAEAGVAMDKVASSSGADAAAPRFFGTQPEVGLPDALLPDAGVHVRAHVRVDAEGRVLAVTTAMQPSEAPAPFQGLSERALTDARFAPTHQPQAYCLQLDFPADADTPTWGWHPSASAERCLRFSARPARPLLRDAER